MSDTFEIEIVGTVRSKERFVATDMEEACKKARRWSVDHLQDDGELVDVSLAPRKV